MTDLSDSTFELSDAVKQSIEKWLQKYPSDQRQSAMVAALFLAQEQNGGWLSESALNAVADYLRVPHIAAYEAATFYDMFNLKPIGKTKISLCTNVACMLRGSDEIAAVIRQKLGIGFGETTPDGLFTLKEVECMAACVNAPVCQVNDREYLENLTPEAMTALIDRCCSEERK